MKTGLILFTHNKFKVSRPLTLVSGIINFLQTGKLKNKKHLPTHTAVTVVINGELYVVDSDMDGLDIELFEKWKEGRAWIQVFDPQILTGVDSEEAFIKRVLDKTGQKYGYKDLPSKTAYLAGLGWIGQTDLNLADDSMICSVTTAYFMKYKDWPKRTPLDLWINRKVDAPFGVDLMQGKPENINL